MERPLSEGLNPLSSAMTDGSQNYAWTCPFLEIINLSLAYAECDLGFITYSAESMAQQENGSADPGGDEDPYITGGG